MSHNPAWHAEYLALENAENAARVAFRAAKKAVDRKRTVTSAKKLIPAYNAALSAFRAASKARFDFEMTACRIVDIATLPTAEWAKALRVRTPH